MFRLQANVAEQSYQSSWDFYVTLDHNSGLMGVTSKILLACYQVIKTVGKGDVICQSSQVLLYIQAKHHKCLKTLSFHQIQLIK